MSSLGMKIVRVHEVRKEGHPFEAMDTMCPSPKPTLQKVPGQIRGSEKQLFQSWVSVWYLAVSKLPSTPGFAICHHGCLIVCVEY